MTKLSIAFFIAGLIVFTTMATFDNNDFKSYLWGHIYDIWQKTSAALFAFICWDSERKRYQKLLRYLFFVCVLRILLSISSWIFNYELNDVKSVGILLLTCCFYVLYAIKNVRN